MKYGDLFKEKKIKYIMKIIPFLINTVIAPHGITDIGHSIVTENSNNLLKIYGVNFGVTNLIINNLPDQNIMIYLLLLSSVIHFRYDFPELKLNNFEIPRYLLASITLFFISIINSDLLVYYMIFFHVPNHFRLNDFHIKKLKFLNIFLYFLTGLLCVYLDSNFHDKLNNLNIINNIDAIIISHIIYQEKYVLNK